MNLSTYVKKRQQQGTPYFTLNELSRDLSLSEAAALAAVHRLKNQGDLISPAKGFYVIVPPKDQTFGSIPAPELVPILMNYLKADYYVALLSAAQYHGATHQRPAYFQVISNKRLKHSLQFGSVAINLIYKKSLANLPTQKIAVKTGSLTIATPELILFDLFKYPMKSGGINHIATVLSELIEAVDPKKLIRLASQIRSLGWIQRLGYILEHINSMDETKKQTIIQALEQYLKTKKKVFIPLIPKLATSESQKVRKWMIIANSTVESDL